MSCRPIYTNTGRAEESCKSTSESKDSGKEAATAHGSSLGKLLGRNSRMKTLGKLRRQFLLISWRLQQGLALASPREARLAADTPQSCVIEAGRLSSDGVKAGVISMTPPDRYLNFSSRSEWRAWLEAHHRNALEAWLVLFKKGSGKASLTLDESVEEALCFGWIDSLLKKLDEDRYVLRFSPRRPGSIWSVRNIKRAQALTARGMMTSAGLEMIADARTHGQWDAAFVREDTSQIPPELAEALSRDPKAEQAFQELTESKKKQYLHWLLSARRSETKEKRIRTILDRLGE